MKSFVAVLLFVSACSAGHIGLSHGIAPVLTSKVQVAPTQVNVVKQPITVTQEELVYRDVPVPVKAVVDTAPVVAAPAVFASPAIATGYAAAPAIATGYAAAPAIATGYAAAPAIATGYAAAPAIATSYAAGPVIASGIHGAPLAGIAAAPIGLTGHGLLASGLALH